MLSYRTTTAIINRLGVFKITACTRHALLGHDALQFSFDVDCRFCGLSYKSIMLNRASLSPNGSKSLTFNFSQHFKSMRAKRSIYFLGGRIIGCHALKPFSLFLLQFCSHLRASLNPDYSYSGCCFILFPSGLQWSNRKPRETFNSIRFVANWGIRGIGANN